MFNPLSGQEQPNPLVQAVVDSVSSSRILSNIHSLVSFHTRHTNSDTISTTQGIGAARRWVLQRFQEFAGESSAVALEPSFFTFQATVCGSSREHRNVLATIPGSATPQRNLLIMGHLDSRHSVNCESAGYAPGANDDGSGTAVAIEVARVLSTLAVESTVNVMVVTGEEQGLVGSTAFANAALQQGMRIDAVLTNDIVGNIEGCANPACPPGEPVITDSMSVRHFSGPPDTGMSRQLSRYLKLQGLRYLPGFTVNLIGAIDRPGRGGDHIPFHNNGFAAARFTEPHEMGDGSGANGRQHNVFDTVSSVNTNAGYMANIARLTVAGFASMALAPSTPGPPVVMDAGDGNRVLVRWTQTNTEPDFAGYRIAVRRASSSFYTLPLHNAGNVSQDTVGNLTDGEAVYISISAYDTAGNESIFSREIRFTPRSRPQVPSGVSSTSTPSSVIISWSPNQELDLVRYRIYRSMSRNSGFVQYDSVPAGDTTYVDTGLSPGTLYYYRIAAVDVDRNESDHSPSVAGRQVTHDAGILVVDGTRDGNGAAISPTDAMVDDYYSNLLIGFNVAGEWDIADSLALSVSISDADMAAYSTVVWHTDVRGSAPLHQDTTALRKYLQHGGKLFLGGWRLSASLRQGAPAGRTPYPAGSFVPRYLKVDSTLTSGPIVPDFRIAEPVPSIYPELRVDSTKTLSMSGALANTDAVLLPFAGSDVSSLYIHRGVSPSSPLDGMPVGWRYLGSDFKVTVFDFPLYFMESTNAREAFRLALTGMGEVTSVDSREASGVPGAFALFQNFPNPFNPVTEIRFDAPIPGRITVVIYDLLGKEVVRLVDDDRPAGSHAVRWNGTTNSGSVTSSGVYYCRMTASPGPNQIMMVRKIVFLR